MPARISEQPVLCSHRLVKLWGGIVSTPKGDGFGGDENGEYRDSPVLLLFTFLPAPLGRGSKGPVEAAGMWRQMISKGFPFSLFIYLYFSIRLLAMG